MKRDTAPSTIPTTAGVPFGGGFYIGRFFIDTQPFALILAPKSPGETAKPFVWNTSPKSIKGAASCCDGLVNTQALVKAGSELGKWANGLAIEGHTDWYVPSSLEALLVARVLLGTKALPAMELPEREWYWTSTQVAGGESSAWCQSFCYGLQLLSHKGSVLRARAVRRLAL